LLAIAAANSAQEMNAQKPQRGRVVMQSGMHNQLFGKQAKGRKTSVP
jgi:hypothetical protein